MLDKVTSKVISVFHMMENVFGVHQLQETVQYQYIRALTITVTCPTSRKRSTRSCAAACRSCWCRCATPSWACGAWRWWRSTLPHTTSRRSSAGCCRKCCPPSTLRPKSRWRLMFYSILRDCSEMLGGFGGLKLSNRPYFWLDQSENEHYWII